MILEESGSAKQEKTIQMVVFKLGDKEFAADILQVKTIEKLEREVTRVPKAPFFIEGVFNLRGEIVPLIDLRKRFSIDTAQRAGENRVVIVEYEGNPIGVWVDAIPQVIRVAEEDIEPLSISVYGIDSYFVRGVARVDDRTVIVLDLERALAPSDVKEPSSVEMG